MESQNSSGYKIENAEKFNTEYIISCNLVRPLQIGHCSRDLKQSKVPYRIFDQKHRKYNLVSLKLSIYNRCQLLVGTLMKNETHPEQMNYLITDKNT